MATLDQPSEPEPGRAPAPDPAPPAWRRVKWTRAGQLANLVDAGDTLVPLAEAPPAVALAALRHDHPDVAVYFLAQCLARHDAVRWLQQCLARTPSVPPASARADIRSGIADWIADPSDKRRRLVFELAEPAGYDTPEGAASIAIFLSGGSMAPANVEPGTPPASGCFGQALGGAVILAALARGAQVFTDEVAAMLDLGVAIAETEPQF